MEKATPADAQAQQRLLDTARNGDSTALGELLDQFRPYVRVLVQAAWRRSTQARQDDSDLIQDAMVIVQQAFPRFRGATVAEFAGWLRTLTLRALGHAIRAHVATGKRGISREQVIDDLDRLEMPAVGAPGAQAEQHERAAAVAAALEQIPADMRAVLMGRFFDGLSYAELSLRMSRSEGALRVLYTRALRRLRDEMTRDPPR